jgi:hypothetical protein
MPKSKTGKKRPPVNSKAMSKVLEAMNGLSERISIREVCKMYKVSLAIISRHLKAFRQFGYEHVSCSLNYDVNRVFVSVQYICIVARM